MNTYLKPFLCGLLVPLIVLNLLGDLSGTIPKSEASVTKKPLHTSPRTLRLTQATSSVLFVGDIMLGRAVETEMYKQGFAYPFLGVDALLASSTYVVANFEGSMPLLHKPTKIMGFRFSIDAPLAQELPKHHVTHVFLANNHAYDFGKEGYDHAIQRLEAVGIRAGGNPTRVSLADTEIVTLPDGFRIGIVPVYAVSREPDTMQLKTVFSQLATTTDMQIAYIHWGEEYHDTHTEGQERLADVLIDFGADAIIGHHPHVVEDIGVYKGVPIFYSLGNFIFDQYFDADVRSELGVRLLKKGPNVSFELIPFFSARNNPVPLPEATKNLYLQAFSLRSAKELASDIAKGVVPLTGSFIASEAQ